MVVNGALNGWSRAIPGRCQVAQNPEESMDLKFWQKSHAAAGKHGFEEIAEPAAIVKWPCREIAISVRELKYFFRHKMIFDPWLSNVSAYGTN